MLQGLWLNFLVGLLAAHWLARAAHEFLQLSWPLSITVMIVFAVVCAQPHLVLFAPIVRWAERSLSRDDIGIGSSALVCLCLGLLFTGLDAIVPRLFDAGLGYALHDSGRLRQVADVGGVSLLTFLIVIVNLLLWRSLVAFRSHEPSRAVVASHLGLVAVLWALAFGYGTVRTRANARAVAQADSTLVVAIVQGNVPNQVRLGWARGDERSAEKQLSTYMLRTEELRERTPPVDLIVWPEATFPGVFLQPRSTLQRGRANKFDRQVLRLNRPIVFGAYDTEPDGEGRILYNALFAITPRYEKPGSPGIVHRYRKHELLAFAEYIPGVSQNEWFRDNLPSLGFFGAGPGAGRFDLTMPDEREVAFGPLICSESLSSQHAIETANEGASVLVNVGSDGWFGALGEPQFHLAAARLRSVETRLPQIRAANTGISALILPGGDIAARTEVGVEAVLTGSVPLIENPDSLMVRWGDWFGRASLLTGGALLIFLYVRQRLRSRRASTF